jgi:hypothetical protein
MVRIYSRRKYWRFRWCNAAYDGLQIYLNKNKQSRFSDGTPEQRFFISWSTGEVKMRDETIKNQVKAIHIHQHNIEHMYLCKMLTLFYKAFQY